MNLISSENLRTKVAKEAANLLYLGVEKEYKQAKLRARKALGVRVLPTNLEVAVELDKIAEEKEGAARRRRLVEIRKQALVLMKILGAYDPVLVGSVWRGTIHLSSDIDIVAYHDKPSQILEVLRQSHLGIVRTEWMTVTKEGKRKLSFHIYLKLETGERAEVIVRGLEEARGRERCEIYGDVITGLRIPTLEKALKEDPAQRYVPF